MTVVDLSALQATLGAPTPITRGQVTVEYLVASDLLVTVDGPEVTFHPGVTVQIVDGAPVTVVDLPPTGGVSCVRWRILSYVGGNSFTRFTSIPDTGPVDFGDLPVVDPMSFGPIDPTPTLLDTIRSVAVTSDDIRTAQKISQADYDLIPTPRPGDVLYVIVP